MDPLELAVFLQAQILFHQQAAHAAQIQLFNIIRRIRGKERNSYKIYCLTVHTVNTELIRNSCVTHTGHLRVKSVNTYLITRAPTRVSNVHV